MDTTFNNPITVKIPHFTKYKACYSCNGRGYKQERGGFRMIQCPVCDGAKKLPVSDSDGQFLKG
jgi:DnaJ-class molecular chaperone